MIFVIAGNYRQAKDTIRDLNIDPKEARPVRSEYDLRGLWSYNNQFLLSGTWAQRKDIDQIYTYLRIISLYGQ